MKYETINGCGELGIEFGRIGGRSVKVPKDFLRKLLRRIVVRSTEYYDNALTLLGEQDHVFTYRERQLHSVVCPSIGDITSYFMIETPLTRKRTGEPEYSGAVDYWIYYKDRCFLVELKHVYFAYRKADNPAKGITRKFEHALKQLNSIRKDESRSLAFGKRLRKIALEVVVFYRRSKEKRRLEIDLESRDFRALFKELVKNAQFRHRPNLRALWILDQRLVKPFRVGNTFETNPAVGFIGNISKLTNP